MKELFKRKELEPLLKMILTIRQHKMLDNVNKITLTTNNSENSNTNTHKKH